MAVSDSKTRQIAEEIARCCLHSGQKGLRMQTRQTLLRLRLQEIWQIAPGARVLEIGCGQGDMTAVLAHAVGPDGKVVGIDIASPEYGSPHTLGEATSHLLKAPFGSRIEFRLGLDVLEHSDALSQEVFDCVVMSHCLWYFSDRERLAATLAAAAQIAPCLCLSEWHLTPMRTSQIAHLIAILIQAQLAQGCPAESQNVRSLETLADLRRLLPDSGWRIDREAIVDSSGLDDGRWEIQNALTALEQAPPTALLDSQRDLMLDSQRHGNRSLHSFALVASRPM